MTSVLRHTAPPQRPGRFARAYAAFATTRIARFISRHVAAKLDPWLLRVTRGRVASTLVFPTEVLETRGARTGTIRRNAVMYFHAGDRVTIVASNAGSQRHPSWFHNLSADPEVRFGDVPMTASIVDGEAEWARLWGLANRVFPAFERYRVEAAAHGRTIPIVQLVPRPDGG